MTATIDGATIGVLVDMGAGRQPFVLDRDVLDDPASLLIPDTDTAGFNDITASVISLSWQWGATDWRGPLTLAEAGGATLELWDPERLFDPANPTLADPPAPGRAMLLQVDGYTFATLLSDEITHSLAEGITTIEAIDWIARASRAGVTTIMPAQATGDQAQWLGSAAGVYIALQGGFATTRSQDAFTGNLLEGLHRLQQAELGQIWADHDGTLYFRARGGLPANPDPVITVGGAGTGATEIGSALDRRIVNAVYITPIDEASPVLVYRDQASISGYGGEASAQVNASDLLLT